MNQINAIYARQSVDKKDSISIESQIEFCEYELRGEEHKTYMDKGYSGKNTDRPDFKKLMQDIESGLVAKVVVYKLDRISRSIMDFANMMGMFQKYNVEFVSSTEKFDTSTPMGRAMLNICIVFAQLERETIQQRVTDSYYSRSQKGFKMGGRTPYGYRKEPFILDGIRTQRFVIESTEAALVTQMYEMYARPEVSYRDVVKAMVELGIKTHNGKPFMHTALKRFLRNPVYVMADMDIYNFYKSQGTVIESDPADFAGTNGCYYYTGRDNVNDKETSYEGQRLVVAPHEGFIPSELWLTVNKKLNTNKEYQPARKASNTWLAGKMKCGHCGYALKVSGVNTYKYMTCTMRAEMTSRCKGVGGPLHLPEVEALVYASMVEKLKTFRTLQEHKKSAKVNPKLVAKQAELAKVESEIENLIDSLKSAGTAMASYVNAEIEKLDVKRRALTQEIAALTTDSVSSEQIAVISNYLDDWENVSLVDKRHVVDVLIVKVSATYEDVQIQWKL